MATFLGGGGEANKLVGRGKNGHSLGVGVGVKQLACLQTRGNMKLILQQMESKGTIRSSPMFGRQTSISDVFRVQQRVVYLLRFVKVLLTVFLGTDQRAMRMSLAPDQH